MRKRLYCVLMAVFILLLVNACTDRPVIETRETKEMIVSTGLESDIAEDSDPSTEEEKEMQEETKVQEEVVSESVAGSFIGFQGIVVDDTDVTTESEKESTEEEQPQNESVEETKENSPIKENDDEGDFLESPPGECGVVI